MKLLDANVFIQAKNFYYGFDIVPSFWKWLDEQHKQGKIATIKPIYEELTKGNDELAQWAKKRKDSGWFIDVDDEPTQKAFANIANWAQNSNFKESAIIEFLDVADSLLVAKAISNGCTIVSHEKAYNPKIKRKIKIPNVCQHFGIKYIDTFDLLRQLGAKF